MDNQLNNISLEELFEGIHSEWHFECQQTGNYAGDMDQLDEWIIEEVLETWNLSLYQKKAIVREFELDHTVLHSFYVIKGGKE